MKSNAGARKHSCIFRILFRMNEIFCISVSGGFWILPSKYAGKWGKRAAAKKNGEFCGDFSTEDPVEKPVESVHNFLYKGSISRRRLSQRGRRTELFHTIPFFYHAVWDHPPSKCAVNVPPASAQLHGPVQPRRRAGRIRPAGPSDGAGGRCSPCPACPPPGPASARGRAG